MSPEERYPPHVDNTDTRYLGDQYCHTDNVR